ncbi:hypothetical protein CRG98_044105, partial [Punica granatum]
LRNPGLCIRLLLSGLRVHFIDFRTSRPRTLRAVTAFWTPRPLYCFQDFASPNLASGYCFSDSASTLLLSGLRVLGLRVRLLLFGLRVHFTAFRTSRPRTLRPVTAFRTPRPLYCFQDFASPDFASGYCFPDSASTLVLSGLRIPGHCLRLLLSGLRVHFSAFRTSRPRTLRPDFASPDFASGYYFPDSASTLLLSGLRVPGLLVRGRGEPPRRATTKAVAGTKKGASHDLWLHPLTEHATKEGQAVSNPFWPTGFPHEDFRPKPGALFIIRQSKANARSRNHEQ